MFKSRRIPIPRHPNNEQQKEHKDFVQSRIPTLWCEASEKTLFKRSAAKLKRQMTYLKNNQTCDTPSKTEMSTVLITEEKQVRLVSVKAERPNHPSRSHARQGGGVLHDNDNTYMTPLGRFNLESRSA